MYNVMGGIYFTPNRWKYACAGCSAFSIFMFAVTPTIYYVVIHLNRSINVTDLLEGVLGIMIVVSQALVLPLIKIFYHKEIETVLEYLANSINNKYKFDSENLTLSPENSRSTSKSKPLAVNNNVEESDDLSIPNVFLGYWNPFKIWAALFVFGVSFNLTFLFMPFIFVIFFNIEPPYLLQHYPLPIPLYDRVSSLRVYSLVVFSQVLASGQIYVVAISQSIFLIVFAILMNNIVFNYCKSMRYLSKLAIEFNERSICSLLPVSNEECSIKFLHHFETDLIAMVNKYRELNRYSMENLYNAYTLPTNRL
jgi:hypothetical protein